MLLKDKILLKEFILALTFPLSHLVYEYDNYN